VHLRVAAVGAVGQEEQRARVRGPAGPGLCCGVGGRPARRGGAVGVDEPEFGVEVVAGPAEGSEHVAEQLPVRGKGRGLRCATIDQELGGQTCHAISLPTSTSTSQHTIESAQADTVLSGKFLDGPLPSACMNRCGADDVAPRCASPVVVQTSTSEYKITPLLPFTGISVSLTRLIRCQEEPRAGE
jgi:hypothetical protein